MTPVFIEDLDDARIGVFRSLKATNATRDLNCFVVEGERLVDRLIASRFPLVSVLVTDRHLERLQSSIPDETPIYVVPSTRIHDLVGYSFHRGALACGLRLPDPDWRTVWGEAEGPLTFAVCPKISNPENLGSIARLCDAFAVDGILTGPSCPDPLSRRVLRVSMGSTLRLPVVRSDDLLALASAMEARLGVRFFAAEAGTATPFEEVTPPLRVGLVLGDEDQGVDPAWVARCEDSVMIPMQGRASSLNVSTAAAILLYHFSRRHSSDARPPMI